MAIVSYNIELDECETLLPVSVLVKRWRVRRKQLRYDLGNTPFWAFKKRFILMGGIAALSVEIDDALEIGGKTNLARIGIGMPPAPPS